MCRREIPGRNEGVDVDTTRRAARTDGRDGETLHRPGRDPGKHLPDGLRAQWRLSPVAERTQQTLDLLPVLSVADEREVYSGRSATHWRLLSPRTPIRSNASR